MLRTLALSGLIWTEACHAGDVSVADQVPGSPSPENRSAAVVLEAPPDPWIATSAAGSRVSLQPSEFPLSVGVVSLAIQVHSADRETQARSVDLISPTMPAHGIVRSPVQGTPDTS